jgi:EmrB/QacA subfamily drug resistance transporter
VEKRPLAIASAGAFVSALSTSLVAVSVPVMARDLHVTPGDVSWVLSSYLLTVSCLLALAGKAADVLGRKRVYLAGFVVFVVGSCACAVAPTLLLLVAARVLQGVGSSMLMAVGPAIVTRAAPPERRARALGLQLAATYLGLTLGPSMGGYLAAQIGWHAPFVVIAAAGALAGALATRFLPADGAAGAATLASLDIGGAALFAIGLASLLVGLRRTQEAGWSSPSVIALVVVALIALFSLVKYEARQAAPVLPLALFRTTAFTLGVVGAVILYNVSFMLAYLLPFQLQHAAGLGPASAGRFMTAQPATMAVIAPLSGILADRLGPRLPSATGMLAIAAGLVGLALCDGRPGSMLVLSLAFVGAGAGLYVAPNSALIMGAAPKERQGVAAAMAATARNLGMTMGIAVAASLLFAIGFRGGVLVAASLAVVGAILAAVRPGAVNR